MENIDPVSNIHTANEKLEGTENLITDIALFYANTQLGRDLVMHHEMQLNDLKDFVSDPEKYTDLFELDEDDINNTKKWLDSVKVKQKRAHQEFVELKNRYVDNVLFKEGFIDVPENFESVYHFTQEDKLVGISKNGLLSTQEVFNGSQGLDGSVYKSESLIIDTVFDQFAPTGFSRTGAVYAFEDFHKPGLSKGKLVLEAKVDPAKTIVADATLVTEAFYRYSQNLDFEHLAKKYWESSMSLDEFKNLSLKERMSKYFLPEVLVPYTIQEPFIKVHSINCYN